MNPTDDGDADRWEVVSRRREDRHLHITWVVAPSDPVLKTRAERALFNGARAAGFSGVVRVRADGDVIHVHQVESSMGDPLPTATAEGWLGVAGIAS